MARSAHIRTAKTPRGSPFCASLRTHPRMRLKAFCLGRSRKSQLLYREQLMTARSAALGGFSANESCTVRLLPVPAARLGLRGKGKGDGETGGSWFDAPRYAFPGRERDREQRGET